MIKTYSEGTARVNGDWIFNNLEFYVQDNWRVSKRLTLDIGMRFYHLPPQTDTNQTIAGFNPSLYSRANAPMLYMPIIDPNGKRVAVDPAHRRPLCQSADRPVHYRAPARYRMARPSADRTATRAACIPRAR